MSGPDVKTIDVIYAGLPFVTGAGLKFLGYFAAGPAQKRALQRLVDEATVSGQNPILTAKQQNVVLKATGFATLTLTALVTFVSSFVALLIVLLKYPHRSEIWYVFALGAGVAVVVGFLIYRHEGSWKKRYGLTAGEFFLGMSILVDCVGFVASFLALKFQQ
jgi:hypothetical protein